MGGGAVGKVGGGELLQSPDNYLNQIPDAPRAQVQVTKRQSAQCPELDLDLNLATPLTGCIPYLSLNVLISKGR